ncbi:MurR/RpiR family transcriptional regulator [Abyssisolibacter fermentans]|uniref:MurR/RpiR family transcriptional regulator n=1 Tax=Abyssisolibacter fermentans TaxID=1766203 RepID=UPI00082C43B3|nr:MurR/RpiR family transcriptional regulator [Abyssisolibacter fermentans]
MPGFYETANKNIMKLNVNEKKLFEYVVKNLNEVSSMSIRELANVSYVSTTTLLRFVRKLGFDGYRKFSDSIKITCSEIEQNKVPKVFRKKEYSEEYLKNIIESVRVITEEQISDFHKLLDKNPTIYLYAHGLSIEAARYAYRLFLSSGISCILCVEDFEIHSSFSTISNDDAMFIFSFTGENTSSIHVIESVQINKHPIIVSITRAGNNIIQNMSDINFYVFSDQLSTNGLDITSRVSMISIIEILVYSYVTKNTRM